MFLFIFLESQILPVFILKFKQNEIRKLLKIYQQEVLALKHNYDTSNSLNNNNNNNNNNEIENEKEINISDNDHSVIEFEDDTNNTFDYRFQQFRNNRNHGETISMINFADK
jgi:hypothetical protein